MKHIANSDRCTIGNIDSDVKLSVTFRGTHTGVFRAELDGTPVQPNPDGTVTLGRSTALKRARARIITVVTQIGPTQFFELDYVLQGTLCGPFTVQNTFDDEDPNATVRETITFD